MSDHKIINWKKDNKSEYWNIIKIIKSILKRDR